MHATRAPRKQAEASVAPIIPHGSHHDTKPRPARLTCAATSLKAGKMHYVGAHGAAHFHMRAAPGLPCLHMAAGRGGPAQPQQCLEPHCPTRNTRGCLSATAGQKHCLPIVGRNCSHQQPRCVHTLVACGGTTATQASVYTSAVNPCSAAAPRTPKEMQGLTAPLRCRHCHSGIRGTKAGGRNEIAQRAIRQASRLQLP